MAGIYRKLEGDEVRFVRIQPGAWTDPIQCELIYLPLPNAEVDLVEAWFSGKPLPKLLHEELYDPRPSATTENAGEESSATASKYEPPSFVALSYVWGDSNQTEELLLDGQPVQKTVNLIAGLRQLRALLGDPARTTGVLHDNSTLFWIDALCINQSDNVEKSAQVPRMGVIYEAAEHVVAWLGENGKDDGDIQVLMNLIDSVVLEDATLFCGHYRRVHHRRAIDALPSARLSRVRHGIESLAQRPWFERTWVVQEVVMSQCTIILAGSHWCYLKDFMGASLAMSEVLFESPKIDDGVPSLIQPSFHLIITLRLRSTINTIFGQKSKAGSNTPCAMSQNDKDGGCERESRDYHKRFKGMSGASIFADWAHDAECLHENLAVAKEYLRARLLALLLKPLLLGMAAGYKATVPHDYVYGILSIGSASIHTHKLAPNYALRYQDVFHEYSKLILEYTGDLAIISKMQHNLEGVPSWVPDFRAARGHPFKSMDPPISVNSDVGVSDDGRVCFTKGVHLGDAVLVFDLSHAIGELGSIFVINWFDRFLERFCELQQLDKHDVLTAVIELFCQGFDFREFQASKVREVYHNCVSQAPSLTLNKQGDTSRRDILTTLSARIGHGLYFVTSRGIIMCLARDDGQPRIGDVLALLKGATEPWLLRPTVDSDAEEYTFVNACEVVYRNTQSSGLGEWLLRVGRKDTLVRERFFACNEVREFRLV